MRRLITLFALGLAASCLTACTVGPDYHRPATLGEDHGWIDPADTQAPEADPWARLHDPVLSALIARAEAAGPDVLAAEARLRTARALRGGAVAAGLPQADVSGSAQRVQLSKNGELPLAELSGFQRQFSLFDAGFDASWEVDLWGANRHRVEAATHQLAAAAARARGIHLEVAAEVVRDYAQLRGAQASIAAAQDDIAARAELAALTAALRHAGETTAQDEAGARQQAHGARADLPALRASARAAMASLALLTGQPPEALLDLPAAPLPQPPADVALGLRSEVLRRRPDVIAAEADLAAANAGIGAAVADMFPRLALLGSIDQQSRTTGLLGASGSTGFMLGPSLHWPIFDAGRLRAQIRAAHAQNDEAAAAYTKAVLAALADSETAAHGYAAARASASQREAALAASTTALALARQRTAAGEDSRLPLLQALSAEAAATRANTQAQQQTLEAYAALIKALGG